MDGTKIKLFVDTGGVFDIARYRQDTRFSGFTTNPSLIKKAGDFQGEAAYERFVSSSQVAANGWPVSLEVVADDVSEIQRQAHKLAALGDNVYVKIPVVNSKGKSLLPLVKELAADGIKINVTAVFTHQQIVQAQEALGDQGGIVSVFCGRIADAGYWPYSIYPGMINPAFYGWKAKMLWASTRELLNIREAERAGFDIITLSPELIAKLPLWGKDLEQYSQETAAQFYRDAMESGYTL